MSEDLPASEDAAPEDLAAGRLGRGDVPSERRVEDALLDEAIEQVTGLEQELASLESALERLESGRYGRCERCDGPIEHVLLDDDATVARCAAHLDG